jgi:DUF1009 family protein
MLQENKNFALKKLNFCDAANKKKIFIPSFANTRIPSI